MLPLSITAVWSAAPAQSSSVSEREREANDLLTRLRRAEKVGYTDFIGLTDLQR